MGRVRLTRRFVLLALAVLLAPRIEASRTSVWERNPHAAVLTTTNAAGLLAPLPPAGPLESTAPDADLTEPSRFDLGDAVLVESPREESFRIALADVVEPPTLRGPPPLDEDPRQALALCDPETRIRGFELFPPYRVGASPTLSLWSRQACGFACREVVSDSRYDPWGLESIREWIGLDTADKDIQQGNRLKGYGKKVGYGVWNALTFGFLERHDRVFERYERTGDKSTYLRDTGAEVGRAAVVGAATMATGGAAGAGAKTLTGAVARGAAAGAVTGVAGTAAGDIYDRARGEAGATVGGYLSSAAGGALFGGLAGGAGYAVQKAPLFRLGSEGEEHVRRLVGAPEGPEYNQVRFGKGKGARIVDVLYDGVANESKVGYLAYSRKNAWQIIKDAKLIKTGEVDAAHWHFFRSADTGQIGADPRLLKMLDRFGIKYTIYE